MTFLNLLTFYYAFTLSAVPDNTWLLYDADCIWYGNLINFKTAYITKCDLSENITIKGFTFSLGGSFSVTSYRDKGRYISFNPVELLSMANVSVSYRNMKIFARHSCDHPIAALVNYPLLNRIEGGYNEIGIAFSNIK